MTWKIAIAAVVTAAALLIAVLQITRPDLWGH